MTMLAVSSSASMSSVLDMVMPVSVVGLGGGEAVGRSGADGESVQADQAAASSATTIEATRPGRLRVGRMVCTSGTPRGKSAE